MKVKLNLLTDTDMLLMVEKVSTKVEYILLLKNIKLVKTEARKIICYQIYNNVFFKTFIRNRNEKMQIFMNKPVYLGLILEINKIISFCMIL